MTAHNFIDLTGQRFGRLKAREQTFRKPNMTHWLCECDCGNLTIVAGQKLRSGRTQSCGCLAREKTSERNRKELRDRDNSAYHVWQMMHQRCSNINRASYPRYGGRGITVCDRWNDFHSFLEDMGPRPSFAYSIHRIDNDGDYEPGNCRWATRKEQAVNRGATQLVTVDGITDSVHATEQRIGINSGSLRDWIKRGRSAQQVVDKWRATSASCRDNRKILFPRSRLTAK